MEIDQTAAISTERMVSSEDLENFRQDWYGELEDERFRRLTRNGASSPGTTETLRGSTTTRNATPQATIRNRNGDLYQPVGDDHMDIDVQREHGSAGEDVDMSPLVIATDFGTTFSSVAFARRDGSAEPTVRLISNFPEDPMTLRGHTSLQVPTESWYPTEGQMGVSSRHPDIGRSSSGDFDDDLYDVSDQEDDQRAEVDEMDRFASMDVDGDMEGENPRKIIWGFGVQSLVKPDVDLSNYKRVLKSKLLLDTNVKTQKARDELRPTLDSMKSAEIIKEDDDVIAHYLTRLFSHAKQQLASEHDIPDGVQIEHVLCVPVVWSAKACRRMQNAMENAIKESGLGTMSGLFLVSEPEAAATFVIRNSHEIKVSRFPLPQAVNIGWTDLICVRLAERSVPDPGLWWRHC